MRIRPYRGIRRRFGGKRRVVRKSYRRRYASKSRYSRRRRYGTRRRRTYRRGRTTYRRRRVGGYRRYRRRTGSKLVIPRVAFVAHGDNKPKDIVRMLSRSPEKYFAHCNNSEGFKAGSPEMTNMCAYFTRKGPKAGLRLLCRMVSDGLATTPAQLESDQIRHVVKFIFDGVINSVSQVVWSKTDPKTRYDEKISKIESRKLLREAAKSALRRLADELVLTQAQSTQGSHSQQSASSM